MTYTKIYNKIYKKINIINNNMKQIIAETKINKSNRSLISTIPNTIVSLESLTNVDSIRWTYEIKNNKIEYAVEFIKNTSNKVSKNNKNTALDIDEVTEKTTKKEQTEKTSTDTQNITRNETTESSAETTDKTIKTTSTSTVISDLNIEKNPTEYFEKMKKNNETTASDKNNKIKISIQKNKRATETNYKLNFRNELTKENITNITLGSLKTTVEVLSELADAETETIKEYILNNCKNSALVTEKLNSIEN